jgi:iron(III) transport system ATP-binding protein
MQPKQSAPAAAPSGDVHTHQIEIANLTKVYHRRSGGGSIVPIDDVTLSITPGELLVLLGPSGCGKTTLLRCVAGLERPDRGSIRIHGTPVFDSAERLFVPPNKRSISMIFQSYALWPHMTVFGNVAYPLKARKMPREQIAEAVTRGLKRVGLEGLHRQYPGQLSGGQQQRVALARALVSDAQVILFDEPLSNVDAKVREELRVELVQMQRDLGFTALYVTHDQAEAMELADRIAVLDRGRIEQLASPREVYSSPCSRYVAEFVGTANLISASVIAIDGTSLTLDTALGRIVSAGPGAQWVGGPISIGTRVYAMMRPEDCEVSVSRSAGIDNSWRARLDRISFSGTYLQYMLTVGGENLRAWTAKVVEAEEGNDVWLTIPQAKVHVLPATHSISHKDGSPREKSDNEA